MEAPCIALRRFATTTTAQTPFQRSLLVILLVLVLFRRGLQFAAICDREIQLQVITAEPAKISRVLSSGATCSWAVPVANSK